MLYKPVNMSLDTHAHTHISHKKKGDMEAHVCNPSTPKGRELETGDSRAQGQLAYSVHLSFKR